MHARRPAGPGTAVLRVVRAARADFAGRSVFAGDPRHRHDLRAYVTDLAAPAGLAVREEVIDAGAGRSYGEMGAALIDRTVRRDEPVDLLILAFSVPDIRPGRATATYLSHVCPGQPFAFAVCDQGSAAPFTALRLMRGYATGSRCRRALLLVAEQATLPYEPAGAPRLPDVDTAVALLCESVPDPPDDSPPVDGPPPPDGVATPGGAPDGAGGTGSALLAGVEHRAGVPPAEVPGQLTRLLTALWPGPPPWPPAPPAGRRAAGSVSSGTGEAHLPPGGAPTGAGTEGTLVVGSGLSGLAGLADLPPAGWRVRSAQPAGWRVRSAQPARPLTGVWWELAAGLDGAAVLADYDPALRYLCLASFAPDPGRVIPGAREAR